MWLGKGFLEIKKKKVRLSIDWDWNERVHNMRNVLKRCGHFLLCECLSIRDWVSVLVGLSCSCPDLLLIPTPEKISPTLLEIPPNSWPNEAFSLRSDARAFLIRGTQYPLSAWPGSEISQVMGGTVDTRSSSLPPTWCIRLRERKKRERCWSGMCWLRKERGKWAESDGGVTHFLSNGLIAIFGGPKLQIKSPDFTTFMTNMVLHKRRLTQPHYISFLLKCQFQPTFSGGKEDYCPPGRVRERPLILSTRHYRVQSSHQDQSWCF